MCKRRIVGSAKECERAGSAKECVGVELQGLRRCRIAGSAFEYKGVELRDPRNECEREGLWDPRNECVGVELQCPLILLIRHGAKVAYRPHTLTGIPSLKAG